MKVVKKIIALLICITACILSFAGVSSAVNPPAGEESLFTTSTSPDALILLDLSGSMLWAPPGQTTYIQQSSTCGDNVEYYSDSGIGGIRKACTTVFPVYGDSSCTGPFYISSGTGHTTDCRRVMAARRAIFSILDDSDDGTINSQDEGSLGVRIGYMRFVNATAASDAVADYTSGANKIIREIGSKYSLIYCANNTPAPWAARLLRPRSLTVMTGRAVELSWCPP